mgnify:CR=1 FL=1
MFVDEAFAFVCGTPVGNDGAATRYDARYTVDGQRYVMPPQTCVYGEVIDALFGLFDECVAENLPRESLYSASYLLECSVLDRKSVV